jgi:hypothetical protein
MYDLVQDPVFWSFFLTTTTAFIFGMAKLVTKSKCKKCKILCCEIERDVEIEEKQEEFELTHPRDEINNL